MNKLNIPFAKLTADSTFDEMDVRLSVLAQHNLEHLLWSNDGYKPRVNFVIAHNGECIFLKFKVEEDYVRANYKKTNDPVYKDTCVEFFISLEDDANYYNLEFNRIGTCTVGYGNNKLEREILPADAINTIRCQTKMERVCKNFVYAWELSLIIPVTVFVHHNNIDLAGKQCSLNFYKCGDDLPQPHFIAWNKIETAEPNFHLPEYLGRGIFLSE